MRVLKKIFKKIQRQFFGNTIKIGDFTLNIGRGHNLPYVLDKYPEYGDNLIRLARCVESKEGVSSIIDIGANVGDTTAMLLTDNPKREVIAIEGDTYFFDILNKNLKGDKRVHTVKVFLGEQDTEVQAATQRNNGTLRIKESNENTKVELITLDSLLKKNPHFKNARILKIDTDGYDNKILRGAKEYLLNQGPVLFFEYDTELLKSNNENSLDIFAFLKNCGYKTVLFYDNHGRFILSLDCTDTQQITQLNRYITGKKGGFAFYDLIVFHHNDVELAKSFIASEDKVL